MYNVSLWRGRKMGTWILENPIFQLQTLFWFKVSRYHHCSISKHCTCTCMCQTWPALTSNGLTKVGWGHNSIQCLDIQIDRRWSVLGWIWLKVKGKRCQQLDSLCYIWVCIQVCAYIKCRILARKIIVQFSDIFLSYLFQICVNSEGRLWIHFILYQTLVVLSNDISLLL